MEVFPLRSPLFAVSLVLLLVLPAIAADPLVGQKVFYRPGAKAKVGTTEIAVESLPFPATVRAVNGDWLWLGRAWVRKQDLMNADEALAIAAADPGVQAGRLRVEVHPTYLPSLKQLRINYP